MSEAAIGEIEAAALLAPLLSHGSVVLAVSGGADSTALMWLAARWLKAGAPCALHVVTVDHGLRPEAAGECASVAAEAKALGLPCRIERRDGAPFKTRVQERARAARYTLLADAAAAVGAGAVVTAHTLDDQAETVLMRLGHGSAVDGLAAMRPAASIAASDARADVVADSHRGGLPLLRPLLGVPKARLVATLQSAGVGWVEDPSNSSRRFERVRLRDALPRLAELGLTPTGLGLLARRAARAADALDASAAALFAAIAREDAAGIALDRERFLEAPEELRLRVLAKAIGKVATTPRGSYPLRLERLERLCAALDENQSPLRLTLGGTVVTLGAAGPVVIGREARRYRGKPAETGG